MIGDISKAEHIYIAAGYTDMRKQIDGLSAIVQHHFNLDPFSNSVFLFCGRNSRIMKVLYWEGDGFVLLYKRLENGKFFLLCATEHNRKNWLFSTSTKGAEASAAVFSLIETAKANKLDPYGYIEFILDYLPQQDLIEHPEKLDWFLPWSEEIKEEFEIKVD